jgi:hypothetical protein
MADKRGFHLPGAGIRKALLSPVPEGIPFESVPTTQTSPEADIEDSLAPDGLRKAPSSTLEIDLNGSRVLHFTRGGKVPLPGSDSHGETGGGGAASALSDVETGSSVEDDLLRDSAVLGISARNLMLASGERERPQTDRQAAVAGVRVALRLDARTFGRLGSLAEFHGTKKAYIAVDLMTGPIQRLAQDHRVGSYPPLPLAEAGKPRHILSFLLPQSLYGELEYITQKRKALVAIILQRILAPEIDKMFERDINSVIKKKLKLS